MNIVCATDDNFVQHCCIMLVSLLCNNKDVEVFILTEGLNSQNQKIIEEEVASKGGSVHFCFVDPSIVEDLPLSKLDCLSHISRATYYRLLISDILPKEIDKAIYLDCDIVVNNSISELWNVNMDNKAIAAVLQIGSGKEAERLGYPMEYGYFNAGVTMINLKFFREYNVTALLLDYMMTNAENLLYNDQDVLNGVLYDKCIHLLPQWNMNANAYDRNIEQKVDIKNGIIINTYREYKDNIAQYRDNPVVLHYVSKPKPWDKNCIHPLYHLYYDYARKTIHYCNIKPQNKLSRMVAIIVDRSLVVLSYIKRQFIK